MATICFSSSPLLLHSSGNLFAYAHHAVIVILLVGCAGAIPPEIGRLSSLQMLRLSRNRLTGDNINSAGRCYTAVGAELRGWFPIQRGKYSLAPQQTSLQLSFY